MVSRLVRSTNSATAGDDHRTDAELGKQVVNRKDADEIAAPVSING
jgi:hypothetical protein